MTTLQQTISSIHGINQILEPAIRSHIDNLTKPPGSLGRMEDLAIRYCLITGTLKPSIGKKFIVAFAGDHGITEEGVSAFPKKVTVQMVRTMLGGRAAINVLARHVGAEVRLVDIGVDGILDDAPSLVRRCVRKGTRNMRNGPAMTEEEALQAIEIGIDLAREAQGDGVSLIGTGEMGIGNTTPSAALFASLLPCSVEDVTGRGTGVDDAGLGRKVTTIKSALAANEHRLSTPLSALAALGGFEIAGICGLILGAAACHMPVVVDGFVASAGALVACKMCSPVRDYLFFSHLSGEAGHRRFFEWLGERPLLDLGMRLGEGTGAALAMTLIEAAVKLYNEMATFSSAGVSGALGLAGND